MSNKYLSTSQYARKYGISRMHVTRLIKSGKINAQKVGRSWMIEENRQSLNQINFEKSTSLQRWNKIIENKFKKRLKIEQSKDREIIYANLHSLGLPHERSIAFPFGNFPSKKELEIAVDRLGYPYWISAVPNPKFLHLNRESKLRIYDINTGFKFISKLPEKQNYKIIVCEYPENPKYKGTLLISPKGSGIAEFITGDRHYIMSRGFTLTDPMLFDQNKIKRYSKTIDKRNQDDLYNLVRGVYGYLEVQYGKMNGKYSISFLDYNNEQAYIEIDTIWKDLVNYFQKSKTSKNKTIYGLPASPGKAKGKCVLIHHENPGMYGKVENGCILVSDTTTPEMTQLLTKASAVITDLGGVTSHAAIVCRELKIPAIVGTKTATEKLNAGDLVQVNADEGEVKILS